MNLDIDTLNHCIAALEGKGAYSRVFKREGYDEVTLAETWTFTTHPIDILKELLPKPATVIGIATRNLMAGEILTESDYVPYREFWRNDQ